VQRINVPLANYPAALFFFYLLIMAASSSVGQSNPGNSTTTKDPDPPGSQQHESDSDSTPTIFPHSPSSPFWLSGQMNLIYQGHGTFSSPYQGAHSLRAASEAEMSRVFTLFTGWQVNRSFELLFDLESAGGKGISEVFGLAGYSNLDAVRNPSLGASPYIARGMLHAVLGLSDGRIGVERTPLSLFTSVPERRLEFRLGRFQLTDFFDLNSAGSDSHLQFLNWTVDNNGGYDYAADTRGYTVGALLDLEDRAWGLRFAEALMPRVANGIDFQWNLARARSENLEVEFRPQLAAGHPTIVRFLSYWNHADMGDYRAALAQFDSGQTPLPDVTDHPLVRALKYGFGCNVEQPISASLIAFGRFGWNEGRHESFVYTEANQTWGGGLAARGSSWRRKFDRAGAAFVENSISGDHRRYLQSGGLGFLLGDGNLSYGREKLEELFYTAHLWRGAFFSFDLQHFNNPGYNHARGPVAIPAVRLHLEL
jgi:hypothetical protein